MCFSDVFHSLPDISEWNFDVHIEQFVYQNWEMQTLIVSLLQVLVCGWFSLWKVRHKKISSSHTADHSGHKALNERWLDLAVMLHEQSPNNFDSAPWLLDSKKKKKKKKNVIYNLGEAPAWPSDQHSGCGIKSRWMQGSFGTYLALIAVTLILYTCS